MLTKMTWNGCIRNVQTKMNLGLGLTSASFAVNYLDRLLASVGNKLAVSTKESRHADMWPTRDAPRN